MGMEPQRRVGGVTDAFSYAELDEILRGTGHSGAIGMSAIDRPPSKWSTVSYVFALEEDCDAEEDLQAGRDRRQVAAG
jgi:hypothetical protein